MFLTFLSVLLVNKTVDISGSRFGLSLTLNIEQYEYMIGPQSDAGIKVNWRLFYCQIHA